MHNFHVKIALTNGIRSTRCVTAQGWCRASVRAVWHWSHALGMRHAHFPLSRSVTAHDHAHRIQRERPDRVQMLGSVCFRVFWDQLHHRCFKQKHSVNTGGHMLLSVIAVVSGIACTHCVRSCIAALCMLEERQPYCSARDIGLAITPDNPIDRTQQGGAPADRDKDTSGGLRDPTTLRPHLWEPWICGIPNTPKTIFVRRDVP